ncbi:uncharacterized protein [Garra rufa]|uniref:uncharacterized protein n=1 Tax=Garra rufa TaxID=137080 RepID=UPI003CCE9162
MSEGVYANTNTDRTRDKDRCTKRKQTPQHTGSDSVRIRRSRAAVVCLVLLCVLLLPAVIVLCVQIHKNNTNYTQEAHRVLTKITNLTEERDKLLTKITNLTEERDKLLTKINNLTEERDQLLTKITDVTEKRDELLTKYINMTNERDGLLTKNHQLQNILSETDGWLYSSFSFYFFSSENKSWTESRRYCTERGADLISINNREEQEFAKKFSHGNAFWIGLTDSDVEGTWKWLDGSTLPSGFWGSGEPNGRRGENCVASYPSGWCDYPCNDAFRWICEKKIFKKIQTVESDEELD